MFDYNRNEDDFLFSNSSYNVSSRFTILWQFFFDEYLIKRFGAQIQGGL